jgi:hypothetical protein
VECQRCRTYSLLVKHQRGVSRERDFLPYQQRQGEQQIRQKL